MLTKLNPEQEVISSRRIAEATEKRHDNVLRDINNLIEKGAIDLIVNQNSNLSATQDEPFCIESSYVASNGKSNFEYQLNEYAANVLAASYDPVIARKLLKLIKQLHDQISKPLSTLDLLEMSIKQLREQESRVLAIENKITELDARTTTRPDYYTIVGYGVIHGIKVNLNTALRIGKRAATICNRRKIEMDSIPDPRFGKVRMYPREVLEEVFNESV